jgi:hypothetical protein
LWQSTNPAAVCGAEFDQTPDAEGGCIPNDRNLLQIFAPGVKLISKRAPSDLIKRGIFESIGNAIKGAVNTAANTVAKGINNESLLCSLLQWSMFP